MSNWIKGTDRLPDKCGNYLTRYNGFECRDDFTTMGGGWWWNVGDIYKPEEVDWDEDSYIGLGEE